MKLFTILLNFHVDLSGFRFKVSIGSASSSWKTYLDLLIFIDISNPSNKFFYLLHRYLLIIKGSRGLPLLLLSHLDIGVLLLLRSSFLLVYQWFLLYLIFFNYILFLLFNPDLINDFSSCERNICNLKCLWFFLLLSTEWFSPSQFFVLSKVISLLSWKDSFIRPCFRVSLKSRRLVWN